MFTPLKTLLIAGGLALGLAGAASTPANAETLRFGNGNLSITFGDVRHNAHHRGFRRDSHRGARFCNPRRALRKARRRGLHDVHIRRVNQRRIVVAGWARGERVVVGMGRHRSCPVHFVRVKDGRRHGRGFDRRDAPEVIVAEPRNRRLERAHRETRRNNRRRDNR